MPNNTKVAARAKTEHTRQQIEQRFPLAQFMSAEDIENINREIVVFEIYEDDNIASLRELLKTNNFFLFISEKQHDTLLLELSQDYHFVFCLKEDPAKEIETRFNILKKHRSITLELEEKTEELESTIFELAFASTNVLEQNEFLEQMAKKDGLTLLYNHSYFKDKLKDEMQRSGRYNNSFCLALLDIDFFKKVNDNFGHLKGDEVLKVFAGTIKECIRSTDLASRYGGEEFAIIFTETDLEHSIMAVERIRTKLAATIFESNDEQFQITFSAGITPYHKCYTDVEYMVGVADKALYLSKSTGRNKFTVLTGEDVCG
ncbi:GGDEF domain-containing protein [Seleniivibrio sp.]|uniref:GGDEF domain-containing protein n=1 Tax=Seleniivibrio sp. TaxID=2898801 RepID=UPI0025F4D660|nr:GGDEF domain-containing protein [Seleniivibrio sp.]MCD8553078.1 GGDEF domain-containing protein [Seleniivibrio sp.]